MDRLISRYRNIVDHPKQLAIQIVGLLLFGSIAAANPVSYERDVLPILETRCNECHHPEETRGGLDLTRLPTMLRGGDELGPALVPGKPGESPLLQTALHELEPHMPKKEDRIPESELAVLRRWIAEGAKDDTPEFSAEDVAFFEREIRPVLHQRCFKCHAGDEPESGLRLTSRFGILAGGERGPAAIPGKPEESRLVAAVRHSGDLKMPRGGDRLSESQIAALEEWIRRGLPWPRAQSVLAREKVFTISEADRNHWAFRQLPELSEDWSVDAALRKRWAEQGLEPAPAADAHRLLRRVTFDLIGYPPTSEEIAEFIQDSELRTPNSAFETVVDRLLDSPQFGWRWGRHWLDYTRNGANGQHNRGPEMDPPRYAAWVAQCFNEDRPWDWFARVHLAGDRMPGIDGSAYSFDLALAAAVPLNGARTFQNASTDTFVLMDKLDEGIEFMGRSLMGVSLECARCHDHKFDPVSQRDYYALLGFFQSSWFGPVATDSQTPAEADASVELYQQLLVDRAVLSGRIRTEATVISIRGGELRRNWKADRQTYLAPWDKTIAELEIEVLNGELKQAQDDGAKPRLIADLESVLKSKREALVDFKPRFFDVVSIKELRYFISGHKSELGLIVRARNVGLLELAKELEEWDRKWEVERAFWGEIHMFGGYPKSAPEVKQLADWHDQILEINAELESLEAKQIIVRVEGGLRRAEELEPFKAEAKADKRQFYPELVPAFVGDARLLKRGDVLFPDERIPRGFPEFFGGETPEIEGSGRLELANWVTDGDSIQSALVARTFVNRAWQNLFGEALCRTPKELGRLGESPEMPELIDGLAARFVESGWSVKTLIREIVMSDAYRQSSVAAGEADAQNRYFARQNVRRLQTEAILNALAAIRRGERFVSPTERDAELLGAVHYAKHFDAPTTDDLIDRRTVSITPSQALFMMNEPTATQQVAGDLTRRILAVSGNTELVQQLPAIYEAVLQRPPMKSEIEFAHGFVQRRREQTGEENIAQEIQEFVHLLLCGNEVIYLE